MRIVTLEEHIILPELTQLIPGAAISRHSVGQSPMMEKLAPQLQDIDGDRLKSMDKNGVTMQVVSVVGAGADLLSPHEGPAFARKYNDTIAEKISSHKTRFAAFAHLPMSAPEAAAAELERTVKMHGFKGALINGLTQSRFLDDPMFAPILERAEKLDVAVYLHPGYHLRP